MSKRSREIVAPPNATKLVYQMRLRLVYRKLSDLTLPVCQTILHLLRHGDSYSVVEMTMRLRIEQSIVSVHLALLLKHEIVFMDRQARHHYYSINPDKVEHINQAIEAFMRPTAIQDCNSPKVEEVGFS